MIILQSASLAENQTPDKNARIAAYSGDDASRKPDAPMQAVRQLLET
jgi:hypothetical protein